MEQAHQVYGFRPVGKRNLEWDLNDWKWDGDLFIASSVNPSSVPPNFRGFPVPAAAGNSLNSSSSCSDDLHPEPEIERGSARDLGHKRRVMVDEGDHEEAGPLSLKLGSHFSPLVHQSHVGRGGSFEDKKTKVPSGSSNRAVCQVDDCGFDLSNAKDYHRRHKVCEMHSKATKALVGNVMQRFCQQCSRFHSLQEFDEGKRSCRRRLAGHNKRRRKTQPEPVVGVQSVNDEQASNVLVSLLKILSDMHSKNSSEERMDHNVVGQIVKSFASQSGTQGVDYISGQLHEYQNLVNGSISVGNSLNISPVLPPPLLRPTSQHHSMPASEMPQERVHRQNSRDRNTEAASSQEPEAMFSKDSPPAHAEVRDSAVTQTKLNDFDLNDIYIDPDDGVEDLERSPAIGAFGTGPLNVPTWPQQDSQQSSPPQISGNSDSASAQSPPSSSSGEDQSRTGRIVFKLFGKDPNDFPLMLRGQVLEWLAHSPTDLESYIRPGCVILTIYLRLAEPIWQELSSNLSSSLSRLLDITDDSFWRSGWVYTRVHNQVSFCYNGQIVANTSLPSVTSYCSRILSVSPIAVSMSELAHFQIKGSNLSSPTTRLVCALQGKYLSQEDYQGVTMDDDNLLDDDEIGCVNLSCSIPSVTGRGFIEVENQGLSTSFFPFIIAEQDVCFEIRMLENVLDHEDGDEANGKLEARHQAMDFIHEMGWLLHRYQVNSRLRHQSPNAIIFSFKRFKFLMEFSMDRDWCAVVKKLLDICLEGIVCPGEHPSVDVALLEMDLVHRAVRRNSRSVVELLLHYAPPKSSGHDFLFRPDKKGPAGLTPLHIAAGTDGSESVLDALTDDPGKVGVEAWKTARDSTGSSPEDYARLRGQYAYIHLVQRKASKTRPRASAGSVVVDVPEDAAQDGVPSFEISRNAGGGSCGACERKLSYGIAPRARVYRPAMLSIVGIAAVCVCVALLFRGSPDVDYVLRPFRWESLEYGSI